MRIAKVIGTVTLSRMHPSMAGARFLIGVPFSLKALQDNGPPDGEQLRLLALGWGLGVLSPGRRATGRPFEA